MPYIPAGKVAGDPVDGQPGYVWAIRAGRWVAVIPVASEEKIWRQIQAPDAGIAKSESPLPSEVLAIAVAAGWPVSDPIEVFHPSTAPGGTDIRHFFERSDGTGGTPEIRKVGVNRDVLISATPNQDDFYPLNEPVVAPNLATDYISRVFVNDSSSTDYGWKQNNPAGAWTDIPPPNPGSDFVTNAQLVTKETEIRSDLTADLVYTPVSIKGQSGQAVEAELVRRNRDFDTVALMQAATNLVDGNRINLHGYTAKGDAGDTWEMVYRAAGRSTIAVDGGHYVTGLGADDYFEAVDQSVADSDRYNIDPTNAAANQTTIAAMKVGKRFDLKGQTVAMTSYPDHIYMFNGSVDIGGVIKPLFNDPDPSAFTGDVVQAEVFNGSNFWPSGFSRIEDDSYRIFMVGTPSHDEIPKKGALLMGISEGGAIFKEWRTIYSDDLAPLWNGAIMHVGDAGKICGVIDLNVAGTRQPTFISSTDEFENNITEVNLVTEGVTNTAFWFGQMIPWTAEFGGDDSKGYMYCGYADTAAAGPQLIRTNNDGLTGSWSRVAVGGAGASETSIVTVPGKGGFAFGRSGGGNVMWSRATDATLSVWSAWVDSGIRLGNNVTHAIYHHGVVEFVICDRESSGAGDPATLPIENVVRTYKFTPDELFDPALTELKKAHSMPYSLGSIGIGYIFTAFDPDGCPISILKGRESGKQGVQPDQSAALYMISKRKFPVQGTFVQPDKSMQVLDNPCFQHWPYGETFTTTSNVVTASRWRINASGATVQMTKNTIDFDKARTVSERGLTHNLKLNTLAGIDNNCGISQYWIREDARRMVGIFNANGEATLVVRGHGVMPTDLRTQIGITGMGGPAITTSIRIIKRANSKNDGPWRLEAELKLPRVEAANTFDVENTRAFFILTNGSGAATIPGNWDCYLSSVELWVGKVGSMMNWDDHADEKRCKAYGWEVKWLPGSANVTVGLGIFRAPNGFDGGSPLREELVDEATVTVSSKDHFHIINGGNTHTLASLVATEMAGNIQSFYLRAQPDAEVATPGTFTDGDAGILRTSSDLARIMVKTGF